MTSRMTDSNAVVNRARALGDLGWRVEEVTDGWKILPPNNQPPVSVHMTYSDVRSLNNLRAQLKSMGLDKDEAAHKRKILRERKEKLDRDRKSAETKAEQLAGRNQELVVRAAGPYFTEVEECDLAWLTTPHPAPWMRWMYITPKAAQILLDDFNSDNRALREKDAMDYALAILSKQWHLTHQGLAMDTRGLVQDAQHRLRAVVIAGDADPDIKVPFAVFVGMPEENFKAIDGGRARTAAQMLAKSGERNPTKLFSLIKAVEAFKSSNPREFMRGRLTTVATFEALEKDPDGYREAGDWGKKYSRRTRCAAGALGAAWYLLRETNGRDNPYVNAFMQGFAENKKHNTALILPDGDPRKVLLSKFNNSSPKPIEAVFWIIHAWNNMAKGHHPSYMRISEDTPPPQILVCKPGAGQIPHGLIGEV